MFEWYMDLDWRIRLTLALLVLGVATLPFLLSDPGAGGFRGMRGMGYVYAVGAVMLFFAFPSRGERNKWGDW